MTAAKADPRRQQLLAERLGWSLGLPAGFPFYQAEHWDRLIGELGRRIREAAGG